MVDMPRINLQPHLGEQYANRDYNKSMSIYLAKILKVHHKHNTADVQLVYSRNVISSSPSTEGKYSARITVPSAHFDEETLTSSGVVEPMQEGQLVMVAFLGEGQGNPVILGSFHDTFRPDNNILPKIYPVDPRNSMEEFREHLKYLRVHPSQFYQKIDGIGSMEMSHPSGTFLKIDPDFYEEINDSHKKFDHKHLSEKDPHTGQTRSARSEETALPVKVLLSHKSSNIGSGEEVVDDASWTKLFIDSDGMLRITRDRNDGSLAYFQISEKGGFTLRKQHDSDQHGEGSSYSQIEVGDKGNVSLSKRTEKGEGTIGITENDELIVQNHTGSGMTIDDQDNMVLTAKTMRLLSEKDTIVHISPTEPLNREGAKVWIDTSDIEGESSE